MSFGSIKVTIKDKPNCESAKDRLCVLRTCFGALWENARDKQRLREIKTNIQSITIRRNLKQCIRVWKMHVEDAKAQREQKTTENSDARKIEMFVGTIAKTQKELTKCQRAELRTPATMNRKNTEAKKKVPIRPFVVESPAQNRLNAQQEIIRKQRIKLAEQNKIIEELKLKYVQKEITRFDEDTIDAAKETLTHCGQQTRRTLIQLMRQAGYRWHNYKFLENPEETKNLTRVTISSSFLDIRIRSFIKSPFLSSNVLRFLSFCNDQRKAIAIF